MLKLSHNNKNKALWAFAGAASCATVVITNMLAGHEAALLSLLVPILTPVIIKKMTSTVESKYGIIGAVFGAAVAGIGGLALQELPQTQNQEMKISYINKAERQKTQLALR